MQEKLKIAVVIGSIREGRFGIHAGNWIAEVARTKPEFDVEVLDLKDFELPMFAEGVSPSHVEGAYARPEVNGWAEKIKATDGFIVVTPEYNHGYPPSLKNAIDHIFKEWNYKPVAFVGYGSVGGARAVEQLRQVAVELHMASVRTGVHINAPWALREADGSLRAGALDTYKQTGERMLGELLVWAQALKTVRK